MKVAHYPWLVIRERAKRAIIAAQKALAQDDNLTGIRIILAILAALELI
jgi:hypothetical protein